MIFRIPYQAPMSSTRSASGRRDWVTILYASSRISAMLFSSAKSGASGKAATNSVTKPYWTTEKKRAMSSHSDEIGDSNPYSFQGTRRTAPTGRGPASGSPAPRPCADGIRPW